MANPETPGPCKAQLPCSHSTQPDLFAGSGIVDAHTRHPRAFVASRTGLAVETRHSIDAAGAREAGVGMSALGTR